MLATWIIGLDAATPNRTVVSAVNQTTRWFLRITNCGPSDINLRGQDPIAPGDTRITDAVQALPSASSG
jgi:hypothetical protein